MAGLPWIRIEVIVPAHPKVQRLEKELGITDALGMLIRLWCWTASYYPGGEIPEESEGRMLEVVAGELGRHQVHGMGGRDPEIDVRDVTPALVTAGLLDRVPGGFRVHDWEEFQGAHIDNAEKKREQNAERQRRLRERRKGVTASRVTSRVTVTPRNDPDKTRQEERRSEETDSLWLAGIAQKVASAIGQQKLGLGDRNRRQEVETSIRRVVAFVGEELATQAMAQIVRQHLGGQISALTALPGFLDRIPDAEWRRVAGSTP